MFISITAESLSILLTALRYDGKEHGALIGADRNGVITHAYIDIHAHIGAYAYAPSHEVTEMAAEWAACGIRAVGFVHSHPDGSGKNRLTKDDIGFSIEFLKVNPAAFPDGVIMGIVCDGTLFPYRINANGEVTVLCLADV